MEESLKIPTGLAESCPPSSDSVVSTTKQQLSETASQETAYVFVFRVGNELMALPLDSICEVLPMCKLTSLPESSDWVAGLLNIRGTMIPVIDLLTRVSRRQRKPELNDFIVVCANKKRRFGLIVQEVYRVYEITDAEIQSVNVELPQSSYVLGVFQIDITAVFLISLPCLLTASEIPEVSDE